MENKTYGYNFEVLKTSNKVGFSFFFHINSTIMHRHFLNHRFTPLWFKKTFDSVVKKLKVKTEFMWGILALLKLIHALVTHCIVWLILHH